MKLMKLKLQSPSLPWGPSKALRRALSNALKIPRILQLIYERNLTEAFSNLTTNLKINMTLPITSCEAQRNFSKLSKIKTKNYINHTRGKTELSVYSLYIKCYYKIAVI